MSPPTIPVSYRRIASLCFGVILLLVLSHCSSGGPDSMVATAPSSPGAAKLRDRPGLGTQLGSEINDSSTLTTFYRKSVGAPDAVAAFHYNDAEGAKLMAAMNGRAVKRGGMFELVPGKLRVAVMPRYSWDRDSFEHYWAGGKAFVVGVPGESYRLDLENLTGTRMEVAVSIDGLDVLDGQAASVRKHGYIVDPKSKVSIQGMRVGGKLKTLNFGTVTASRAATAFGEKGARNVGVIGMACYEEDEGARRLVRVEENYLRGGARAFGGN